MGLFDKGTPEATEGATAEAESSGRGDPVSEALAEARGGGATEQPRRRKPRSDTGKPRKGISSDADKAREDFAKLMEVETFEAVVRFPADVGLMLTGKEYFRLPDSRVKPVAVQMKIAASYWMAVDPKYLSLVCLGLGMVTLYTPVLAAWREDRRREAAGPEINGTA